jgi:hypothetical protein
MGSSEEADSSEVLVTQAVRFLQNESVRNQPAETKRQFLQGKGLTGVQIDKALVRADVSSTRVAPSSRPWMLWGGIIGAVAGSALVAALACRKANADGPSAAAHSGGTSGEGTPHTRGSHADDGKIPAHEQQGGGIVAGPSCRIDAELETLREMSRATPVPLRSLNSPPAMQDGLSPEKVAAVCRAITLLEEHCLEGGEGAKLPTAFNTLLMLLNSQLRRPEDVRYHRLHRQNANLKSLLALPGATDALAALGFVDGGGPYWVWRGFHPPAAPDEQPTNLGTDVGSLPPTPSSEPQLPNGDEMALIKYSKDFLTNRLQRLETCAATTT